MKKEKSREEKERGSKKRVDDKRTGQVEVQSQASPKMGEASGRAEIQNAKAKLSPASPFYKEDYKSDH